MPTYFKPLRRKIGVLTLGLACALMAFWLRSFTVADVFTRGRGVFNYELISYDGELRLVSKKWRPYNSPEPKESALLADPRLHWTQPSRMQTHQSFKEQFTSNLHRYPGLWFGTLDLNPPETPARKTQFYVSKLSVCVTQYSTLAIPLTLLSAWLLLSKPRAGKAKANSLS